MPVAHLGTHRAEAFAGGDFLAFDQPGVGDELLHALESNDVVDFIEDR